MHKRLICSFLLFAVFLFSCTLPAYGEKYMLDKMVLEQEIEVIADTVNVRSGPGENFPVTGAVSQGDRLEVLGMLGNWYIIYLPEGAVGVIRAEYAKVVKIGDSVLVEGSDDTLSGEHFDDDDQSALFALVNTSRAENRLAPYAWDEKLNKVAQLKADDMVRNDYFGHDSTQYGTPFQMLKALSVGYKSASENIARNRSIRNAHIKIMSHPANRANILNTHFTKMGVGVANSPAYGKIIVQLFIQT